MVARPRLRRLGAAVSGPRLCAGPGPVPRLSRLCLVGPGWRKTGLACFAVGPGAPVLGARCLWPGSSLGFLPGPFALLRGPFRAAWACACALALLRSRRSAPLRCAQARCCVPRPGFPLTSLPSLSAPPGLRGKREASGLGAAPRPSGTPLLCLSMACPATVPGSPCSPCPALCAGGASCSGEGLDFQSVLWYFIPARPVPLLRGLPLGVGVSMDGKNRSVGEPGGFFMLMSCAAAPTFWWV